MQTAMFHTSWHRWYLYGLVIVFIYYTNYTQTIFQKIYKNVLDDANKNEMMLIPCPHKTNNQQIKLLNQQTFLLKLLSESGCCSNGTTSSKTTVFCVVNYFQNALIKLVILGT